MPRFLAQAHRQPNERSLFEVGKQSWHGSTAVALHMYSCPHCSVKSISAWSKVTSTPFSPVTCSNCKAVSFVSGWSRSIAAIGTELLLWCTLVLVVLSGSLYALLALPAGLVVLTLMLGQAFPLIPGDAFMRSTRTKVVRRVWWVASVAALVIVIRFLYERSAG